MKTPESPVLAGQRKGGRKKGEEEGKGLYHISKPSRLS